MYVEVSVKELQKSATLVGSYCNRIFILGELALIWEELFEKPGIGVRIKALAEPAARNAVAKGPKGKGKQAFSKGDPRVIEIGDQNLSKDIDIDTATRLRRICADMCVRLHVDKQGTGIDDHSVNLPLAIRAHALISFGKLCLRRDDLAEDSML